MEKRTILAIILIIIVYWLSTQYFWKPAPPTAVPAVTNESIQTPDKIKPLTQVPAALSTVVLDSLTVKISVENNLILENDFLKISFTNVGGCVNSIELKKFKLADEKTLVQLIPNGKKLFNLTLNTQNGVDDLQNTPLYHEFINDGDKQGIKFYLKNGEQEILSKTFILDKKYNLQLALGLANYKPVNGYDLFVDSGIKMTENSKASLKAKPQNFAVISQIENEIQKIYLAKLKTGKEMDEKNGKVDWGVVRSKYFMYGVIPEKRINSKNLFAYDVAESPAFRLGVRNQTYSNEINDKYTLYLGPVDYTELKLFNNGIDNTLEKGWNWLHFISSSFLWFLTLLNKSISNYGIIIIIFAFVLKVILTPLTTKSLVSTHQMQKINPLMQELQRKYKNDPRQLQIEMGKLYKEHKVNPLGGCLPLLLQMPVFFALYPILNYAIDLRQASFMLWMTDLSEPDPYYILPVLMGVFMFLQQKLMPMNQPDVENMDEKQRAAYQSQKIMMYLMPVFMVWIFATLPSGLVLYWMVFNIFSIIQQYYLMKKLHAKG